MATPRGQVSVVVISMGRPDCLKDITECLNAQTRLPQQIVFVVTDPADVPLMLQPKNTPPMDVVPQIIIAAKGTCHQRNIGIDAVTPCPGIIAFFDDDYVPAPNAIEAIETAFNTFGPDVGGMSGHLIADGINGDGISLDEAKLMTARHQTTQAPDFLSSAKFGIQRQTIGLYGCNMALRGDAIGQIRFDERLPLYAWQEDVDFSHRVGKASGKKMILTDAFAGVHRGVKNGREKRGARLGYSQVANNWFLWKNNGLPGGFALRVALRNVLANHAGLARPSNWIDRRGRAYGNRMALRDILTGRLDPARVHEM